MLLETDIQLSELQKSTQTQLNLGKLELGNISPGCYTKFVLIRLLFLLLLIVNNTKKMFHQLFMN